MLCDAFSELGRLPARPSPVEPAIILGKGPETSHFWLVLWLPIRPFSGRQNFAADGPGLVPALSALPAQPDSYLLYKVLIFKKIPGVSDGPVWITPISVA